MAVMVLMGTCIGCTKLKQYRTDYSSCSCTSASYADCKNAAIELHTSEGYALGYVEIDDQGTVWDREQQKKVIGYIDEAGKNPEGYLLVTFIHGWKHNASSEDGNVQGFRESLQHLAQLEIEASKNAQPPTPPRKIIGVYIGWRGLSATDPLNEQLSFWDRKNTAERVGHGAVTEFLRLAENSSKSAKQVNKNTSFVVVGHSFGGLVLYSSLSQIMMERMACQDKPIEAFGDLVVMINPAIEAARFTPLRQISADRSYEQGNFPALVIMTSKADWATKFAFKVGRKLSTTFDTYRDDAQEQENVTAVGHYDPFVTHELIPLKEARKAGQDIWDKDMKWEEATTHDGYVINFHNVQLLHKDDSIHKSDPKNPIMVISVDKNIIGAHNDIFNTQVRLFLADLIISKPQE